MIPQRYAYIKNGDPIDQLEELKADARDVPQGGPNAFIADFLRMTRNNTVLILSGVDRDREKRFDKVMVRTFSSHLTRGNALQKMMSRVSGTLRLGVALFRFRPDIIVCGRTREILWVAYLVSRLRGAILIHSRHNRVDSGPGRSLVSRVYSWIDGRVINGCDAVICHGPYLKDQLIDAGVERERIFEFDSGFADFSAGSAMQENMHGADERKIVLFVGRVELAKGVVDLFEALLPRLLSDETVELVYAGDGSARDTLQGLIEQHGLKDRVILAGRINHEKLPGLLARAHLLVMPTRSTFPEGRCMSVMEGLVMGLPVIAPDFGPFPYLVKDGVNGLLFRPDSVQQLGEAIGRLLDDSELYESLSAGARASGDSLKHAQTGFAGAIQAALDYAGRRAGAASV